MMRAPLDRPLRVVLVSTYDLGRQPFGLASPAAFLRAEGAEVVCMDLAVARFDVNAVARADLVAFHLPMHTATRIATRAVARVRQVNPSAHLCFYGLYAPLNAALLRRLDAGTILGGEYEEELSRLARRLHARCQPERQVEPVVSLERLSFRVPWREGLPPLSAYARLRLPSGEERLAGSTEASRGCRHMCRHCPVVPVYRGRFRVIPKEIVLEDIRRQVAAGARHITFGDPDFLNGPAHALAIATALHDEHPGLTFDMTAKIEHLLRHEGLLARLRESGCLFVTSAVESLDDRVLGLLDKGHTREDFLRAVEACRRAGLSLHPTFIPFTPWTTRRGYLDLLETIEALDLEEAVAPLQLALRLLIPAGSLLLQLDEIRRAAGPFDESSLTHPWSHADPGIDQLQRRLEASLRDDAAGGATRRRLFSQVRAITCESFAGPRPAGLPPDPPRSLSRAAIPYMTEPWYC